MADRFDIDYKLLPPKLQMQLWVLALDADTSKVNLAYTSGTFRTSLAYNYGGNLQASLGVRRFALQAGVNPGNGNLDMGLVYRGFRFGTSASFTGKAAGCGFSLGYGAALLPFPQELASTFNSASIGLMSMTRDIQAAPNNPLAWYKLHSDDVNAISSAIRLGRQIASQGGGSNRFGVGLRMSYDPQTKLTLYGGAQLLF